MHRIEIVGALALVFLSAAIQWVHAAAKLPYAKGESFVVVQGYDTPPTHIGKDAYAIDFSQDGCDAYGKEAVAAESGVVRLVVEEGYNGGYGTEVIIAQSDGTLARYAHLIPDSIGVAEGVVIGQGDPLGKIGNTGLVAGAACRQHPGTHLHFAIYVTSSSGAYDAKDPEPISGYENIAAGRWYISDNGPEDASLSSSGGADISSPIIEPAPTPAQVSSGVVLGASLTIPFAASSSPTFLPVAVATPGSVTVLSANQPSPSSMVATPSAPSPENDVSSSPENAPSSPASDTSTTDSSKASSSNIIFTQPDAPSESVESWYSDNWFDLGSGFSGVLHTLILRGRINHPEFATSEVDLQAFADASYTALVSDTLISDNAPFGSVVATATFNNLSIVLRPYFYYRLTTMQTFQNRSVLLEGASDTSLLAMYDNYLYGASGINHVYYNFAPFVIMEGDPATSAPPTLTTPGIPTLSFDPIGLTIAPTWAPSLDPGWSADPIGYDVNYSTSTTLDPAGWRDANDMGTIPVEQGSTYLIGVRAKNSFGDVSMVATTSWSFPEDFVPYFLSNDDQTATQTFIIHATDTLQSIEIFTADFNSNSVRPSFDSCTLSLVNQFDLSVTTVPSDDKYSGPACAGNLTFWFASSSPILYPDNPYQWVFHITTVGSATATVEFYGPAANTAGGFFSDPSMPNAKFTVTGASGILFSN